MPAQNMADAAADGKNDWKKTAESV